MFEKTGPRSGKKKRWEKIVDRGKRPLTRWNVNEKKWERRKPGPAWEKQLNRDGGGKKGVKQDKKEKGGDLGKGRGGPSQAREAARKSRPERAMKKRKSHKFVGKVRSGETNMSNIW